MRWTKVCSDTNINPCDFTPSISSSAQEKEYKQHAKRDSSDLDEDDTSSPGPKRRKPRPKQQTPDWTKMSSAAILWVQKDISLVVLCLEFPNFLPWNGYRISSDDDDDDVILQNIENAGSSSKHSPQDADKSMRQRSRSRSRSITPPPPIPADHMALMKERIRYNPT